MIKSDYLWVAMVFGAFIWEAGKQIINHSRRCIRNRAIKNNPFRYREMKKEEQD